jgi:hypothetical protein
VKFTPLTPFPLGLTFQAGAIVARIAIRAIFLLPCAAGATEVRRELHLSWSELHAVVPGHLAKVKLAGGGSVVGSIDRFPRLLIPASEVREIRIEKRTKRWRAILTVGLPSALILSWAAAVNRTHPTPNGAGIAGYLGGRRLDRRDVLVITIVP